MDKTIKSIILTGIFIACVLLGYGIFGVTVKDITKKNDDLTATQVQLINQINGLRADYDTLNNTYESLYETSDNQTKDILNLNNQISSLKEEIRSNETRINILTEELNNTKTEDQAKINDLKDKINTLSQKNNELQTSLDNLQSQYDSKCQELTQAQQTIVSLQTSISEKDTRINELVEQLNSNNTLFKKLLTNQITELTAKDLEGVTTIRDYMFYGTVSLEKVTIPNTVTVIGSHAFENCSNLKIVRGVGALNILKITSVGDYAFSGCVSLSSCKLVTSGLSSNLKTIGERAFYGCSSLSSISYGFGLTNIGIEAFAGSGLTSFTFRSNISVGASAFKDCSKLTKVSLDGNSKVFSKVPSGVFNGCSSLKKIAFTNIDSAPNSEYFSFLNDIVDTLDRVEVPQELFEEFKTVILIACPTLEGKIYEFVSDNW